jgi:hypothetical protein
MKRNHKATTWLWLGLPMTMASAACTIQTDSDILDAAKGCEELSSGELGAIADLRVRALVAATIEFQTVSEAMRAEVLAACSGIALDLGAGDSWSSIEDEDAQITNDSGTGACDVANAQVTAVLDAAAQANIQIGLAVTEGTCYPNFEAQAQCELGCAANTECTPGTIEERCEPGSLSVLCQAECSAEAYCQGTPEVPANCMGKCASTCQGECKGTCIAPDGSVTENDPSCMGKCSSSCNGLCRGLCKVEAPEGVQCGAAVSCRGGCTSSYTEPKCTTEFTPPMCSIDESCYAGCAAEATAKAVCEPPHVEVYVDVVAMADGKLEVLVSTLETNLSRLVSAAQTQGKLAVQAIERLSASAQAVAEGAGDLDGKSLACAGAAARATLDASLTINASFNGSASVVETCDAGTQ